MKRGALVVLLLVLFAGSLFSETQVAQEKTAPKNSLLSEVAVKYPQIFGGVCVGFLGWAAGNNLGHQFMPKNEVLSATSFALAGAFFGYSLPTKGEDKSKEFKLATGWLVATVVSNAAMWLTKEEGGYCFLISLPLSKCLWDLSFGRTKNDNK